MKTNNNTLSKTFVKSTSINYKHTILAHTVTSIIYALFVTTAVEYSNRNVAGLILWHILYLFEGQIQREQMFGGTVLRSVSAPRNRSSKMMEEKA